MRLSTTLSLAIVCVFLSSACDSGSDVFTEQEDTPRVQENADLFEARITSADGTRTVSGTSTSPNPDSLQGGFYSIVPRDSSLLPLTVFELASSASGERFVFFGYPSGGPAAETGYDIGSPIIILDAQGNPVEEIPDFYALYFAGESRLALASSGTLTFTTVSDDKLAGTFTFEARERPADSSMNRDITVEGTFTTTRRAAPSRTRSR